MCNNIYLKENVTNPSRCIYRVIEIEPDFVHSEVIVENIQAELDRMSAQGWELITAVHALWAKPARLFFKRPQ